MKSLFATLLALTVTMITAANAANEVIHYACKLGDDGFALTVNTNRGVVKLLAHTAPYALTAFRILKTPAEPATCGKGGWILNDGGVVCYYTKGAGSLSWQGHEYECEQADTD
jgi:hypothetical protein